MLGLFPDCPPLNACLFGGTFEKVYLLPPDGGMASPGIRRYISPAFSLARSLCYRSLRKTVRDSLGFIGWFEFEMTPNGPPTPLFD